MCEIATFDAVRTTRVTTPFPEGPVRTGDLSPLSTLRSKACHWKTLVVRITRK